MDYELSAYDLIKAVVSLSFILIILIGGGALIRKYGSRLGFSFLPQTGTPERLSIKESLVIGPKQRILLIQRDNKEHLIMVSSENASVIETNIQNE